MPSRVIRSNLKQSLVRKDKRLRAELTGVAETTAGTLHQMHREVVRDWNHKPRFREVVTVQPDMIVAEVTVDRRRKKEAQIWIWVDQGTKAHVIRPKRRGGKLKFQTGYNARTAPVAKYGVGDGRKFGPWATKDEVQHPGTKARLFTRTFSRKVAPKFRRGVRNALARAIRR